LWASKGGRSLRLVLRAIVASSREVDLLFDPFCGSGSTGVASKELDRFFVVQRRRRSMLSLRDAG
jgi:site-specific DNA-methyltransferase (adenine-specific)